MRRHHVDPQEAVQAHLDLRPRRSLGMHFGTFQLTDEAIDAPALALGQARAQAGLVQQDFDVLDFGETRKYVLGRRGYASVAGLQKPGCDVPFFQ